MVFIFSPMPVSEVVLIVAVSLCPRAGIDCICPDCGDCFLEKCPFRSCGKVHCRERRQRAVSESGERGFRASMSGFFGGMTGNISVFYQSHVFLFI